MPVDPSIPLRNLASRASGSPVLEGLSAGQAFRLRGAKLRELERQEADQQALKEIFAGHAQQGTMGSESFLRDVGAVSPQLSMRMRNDQLEQRHRKLKIQSDFLQQIRDTEDFLLQKISACIELGDTPEGQACYERSKAEVRDYLSSAGIDTSIVDSLPRRVDIQMLNTARMQRLTAKEQADIAWREKESERKLFEQRMLMPGRVEEARLKAEAELPSRVREAELRAEATEPSRLRVAERRGIAAAERQAEAQIRAAEIEKTAQPLTGAQAKSVADLDASLELLDDMEEIFKPEYVGQISGRAGAVREFTGQISDEEVEMRQIVQDVKDTLLRARSGAAITVQEYNRLSKIVPNITDQPNVFKAKLRRFRRNLERLRSAKLAVATTGRSQLNLEPEQVIQEPTLSIPAVTEADIAATVQSSGRSRQEVIDAFRRKGYALPEGLR